MPARTIAQQERNTMPYAPQTLEIIRLAKEGKAPKAINEMMPHLSVSVISKTLARARAKGDLNIYFNKDGSTKTERRLGSDRDSARNYFCKRGINLGRSIDAVTDLDRETLQWVVRQIGRDGYISLGEFLRDLVIQAYDDRFQRMGGTNGKTA